MASLESIAIRRQTALEKITLLTSELGQEKGLFPVEAPNRNLNQPALSETLLLERIAIWLEIYAHAPHQTDGADQQGNTALEADLIKDPDIERMPRSRKPRQT